MTPGIADRWPYPRWIAHRGAGKLAPENTLTAFRTGAGYGYRMFECDVKLSRDDVPFLLHDSSLQRCTDAGQRWNGSTSQVASEHDWSELSRLDAGSWHSRAFAGEPLPTFEAIARYCLRNHFFLNIEIKPTEGADERTGTVVAQHAARLWRDASTQPLLSSFSPAALAAAQRTQSELPRALLLDSLPQGWLETALRLECVAVVCNQALWNTASVAQAQSAGLRCLSYTVNDEWAAQRLLSLGTDGIITDRIDLFSPAH